MKHRFNPPLTEIQTAKGTRLLFVHVGKCAGETLVEAFRAFLPDSVSMFEMHCFDANRTIRAALESDPGDLVTVIVRRDPVARFVSAFNWDKHNLFLKGTLAGTPFEAGYTCFPSADALITALATPSNSERPLALRMARFAHMGMGQAWYTPRSLVESLDPARSFVCDTKTLKRDTGFVLRRMGHNTGWPEYKLRRAKADYKRAYADAETLFPDDLSPANRIYLTQFLSADRSVYAALDRLLPAGHPLLPRRGAFAPRPAPESFPEPFTRGSG